MVSKKINKIIVYKAFSFSSVYINFNILKFFTFADIDIIYQIFFFQVYCLSSRGSYQNLYYI